VFKLITVSNRGTQVWPTGSSFTNLVNQYGCRFEAAAGGAVTQTDVLELYRRLMQDFKICSTELLNQWGEKKGYSMAQGQ
jgi:isocitrate dehydrogenase